MYYLHITVRNCVVNIPDIITIDNNKFVTLVELPGIAGEKRQSPALKLV